MTQLENGRLSEEELRQLVQRHQIQPVIPPEHLRWRRAAVLLPLVRLEDEWHLLFIRRTEVVAEHKGQVAFPGGAMDPEDETIEDTALREAWEEIGLLKEHVRILGRLSDFYTITNYLITPVVGVIHWPFDLRLSIDEVSRAFTIPLAWLADTANQEERLFTRPDSQQQDWVIFYKHFDGEMLWGATARITVNFLRVIGLRK